MLVRAGEMALDGFNRFDGRVADLSLYFVLKTHALDFIFLSHISPPAVGASQRRALKSPCFQEAFVYSDRLPL